MVLKLYIGGIKLYIEAERELIIDSQIEVFTNEYLAPPDVVAKISWDWKDVFLPEKSLLGEDLIHRYYKDEKIFYCLTKAGQKGPIAVSRYYSDYKNLLCTINEKPFLQPPKTLGSVLRMLPMKDIFLRFGTLFFHSSQISYKKKGILFAASSGTGKTTQAKLWKQYRNAKVLCNDRTLIHRTDGIWYTHGYPIDGSEPIISNEINELGCIVLLEQGTECEVRKLESAKAIRMLMEQLVINCWSEEARNRAIELLLALIEDIPILLLKCTPNEGAVLTLEKFIEKAEVIKWEK